MTEILYTHHDNAFAKQLTKAGAVLKLEEMTAINQVALLYMETLYSSTDYPTAFDWQSRTEESTVIFKPGNIPTIPAGRDKKAEIIIYAPDYADGIVWGTIDLKMIDLGV